MFGYVKAHKPELKMAEYDTYKAVYCSLCRQLGKDYGVFAKFILSYDFVFLAMLKLGLQDECCGYKQMRCPFNPTKKCMRLEKESKALSFSAACLVIMFYYKLLDDMADNGLKGKLRSGLILPIFKFYRKKARKTYAKVDDEISKLMQQQADVEAENSDSVDKSAEPTAKMLEFVFSFDESDETKRVLERVGYICGKWVYLIDAFDDFEDDLKNKSFNPFKNREKTQAKGLINNCNVELANSFELLNLKRYKTILSNIIYQGLPNELKRIENKEKK